MIPETPWVWAREREFRHRMAQLRDDPKAGPFEQIGLQRFHAAAGPVTLSGGYVSIIEAAAYSDDPDFRSEFTLLALTCLDGELCNKLVWPFVGAETWVPLRLEHTVLEWVVHNGVVERVPTVFAADDRGILVAMERELPLPPDYWIEKQLFRAEFCFRAGR